jgi:imidazole glycerol phosphate synthase glutamine amidotransferase subunit
MTTRVAVVDYGMGNLQSVVQALRAAAPEGTEILRTNAPDAVRSADRVVVPGQGGFRDAAARLREDGLGESILEKMRAGTPYLGICLGLQMLFESSEEAPGAAGFGWFKGAVKKLVQRGAIRVVGLSGEAERQPLAKQVGGHHTRCYGGGAPSIGVPTHAIRDDE